jgi:hypothetical protein
VKNNIISIGRFIIYYLISYNIQSKTMEGESDDGGFDATFIETPAILDKYKGAAGIANGKLNSNQNTIILDDMR